MQAEKRAVYTALMAATVAVDAWNVQEVEADGCLAR
jgi:hypothetical protein